MLRVVKLYFINAKMHVIRDEKWGFIIGYPMLPKLIILIINYLKIPCQFFIFSITPKSFWKNGWKLSLNCEFAWQIYKEPRSFHHLNTYGFFSMNSPKWFPFYDNPIAYLIGRSIIFNLSFFISYILLWAKLTF